MYMYINRKYSITFKIKPAKTTVDKNHDLSTWNTYWYAVCAHKINDNETISAHLFVIII